MSQNEYRSGLPFGTAVHIAGITISNPISISPLFELAHGTNPISFRHITMDFEYYHDYHGHDASLK